MVSMIGKRILLIQVLVLLSCYGTVVTPVCGADDAGQLAQTENVTAGESVRTTEPASKDSASSQSTTDVSLEKNAAAKPETESTKDEVHDELHEEWKPWWQVNNPVFLFGMLMAILGLIFWSSSSDIIAFKRFYHFVPMLLLCYFVPSLLTLSGVSSKDDVAALYHVSSRYLLPACLVLLTMSVDLKEIIKLGPKALIMFLTGTVGVVFGGPLAVLLTAYIAPDLLSTDGADATWRGLSTVAGSWIGGGANQTAMKVLFEPSQALFTQMAAVDVIVAEVWMAFLLIGVGYAKQIDSFTGADSSSIETLKQKMEQYSAKIARIPTTTDIVVIAGVGFFVTGISHFLGEWIAKEVDVRFPQLATLSLNSGFFWLIVLSTLGGIGLSFTRARELEGAGASKIATVFIFILVATIGLQMDLRALWKKPEVFAIGGIWMAIHVLLMVVVAFIIRAPYFFLAVGSKANIGGAASAPVLAGAFHPSLAPVGVLLAVLGYALGTFGAYLSAIMMKIASGDVG